VARKSIQQATDKWTRRTPQAAQDYAQGVQNATNWAERAVAASNRRNMALQAAIQSGAIDAGIQRTGDAGWKAKTVAKGVPNWSAGVAKGGGAYSAGLQKAYGYLAAADQAVANLPTDTAEQRAEKSRQYQLAVHRAAQAAKGLTH
jgi:hypothetical protein